jgi:hypothetical protein
MHNMTKEELEEYQERLSKLHAGAPETLAFSTKQRLQLIANLIVDRMVEDRRNGSPLLRKIQRETKSETSNQEKA